MVQYILTMPEGTTDGTFTLSVAGKTTGDINHPATAAGIQSALRAIDGASVTVSGSNGGPFTIDGLSAQPTADSANLVGNTSSITIAQKAVTTNMVEFDALSAAKGKLIRKALGGIILVAPMTVDVPEKITDAEGNLIDFAAAGFHSLGWLTKSDGINFTRETEQAEVESFGAQEPTRIDFVKDVTSAAFRCQETNKHVLELYYGKDLSETKADASGEVSFVNDSQPSTRYNRVIYIAKDGNGDDAKYIAKIMPKAIVAEAQDQSWSSESELSYGMTIKATTDDDLNYSVRHVFGGPGMKNLLADMGF